MGSMPVQQHHTNGLKADADRARYATTAISRPELRGLWVRDTLDLVKSQEKVSRLLRTAQLLRLTDIYLYVCPAWWYENIDNFEAFNTQINAASVRIWAYDGERAYIDNIVAEERQMEGLQALVEFNDYVDPSARFFGFHSDTEPQDTPDFSGWLHEGVPMSQLNPQQTIQRDILMHKWLNVLTRASGFCRSHDLPFSAALPYWLHDYEGEPIIVPWVKGTELSTCVMELIMPLVDQYIVLSCSTDPIQTVRRVQTQAQFASTMFKLEGTAPLVLANIETGKGDGTNVSYTDTPGKNAKSAIIGDVEMVHKALAKFQAFGGVAVRHWEAFEDMPDSISKPSATTSNGYDAVVKKLGNLNAKG